MYASTYAKIATSPWSRSQRVDSAHVRKHRRRPWSVEVRRRRRANTGVGDRIDERGSGLVRGHDPAPDPGAIPPRTVAAALLDIEVSHPQGAQRVDATRGVTRDHAHV